MPLVHLTVYGSEATAYRVTIEQTPDAEIRAFCTCDAGRQGKACRHRNALLQGDFSFVDIESLEDAKTAVALLPCSLLEKALERVKAEQTKVDEAQLRLKRAKQALDLAMRGSLR